MRHTKDKMGITKKPVCLNWVVTICQVLCLLLFSMQSFAVQEKHDPQTLVVHYTELFNLIASIEQAPSVSIYSDGFVQIFYPNYMRRAGHYTVHLSQTEMSQLYHLLADKKILAFDEGDIRNQMAVIRQSQVKARALLSKTSDVSKMTLDIFPGRFRLDQFAQDKRVHIIWSGLEQDIQFYPEIDVLQTLNQIQQSLTAIMTHPNIQKVDR